MMGFDDRDLAEHAVRAGFARVHVECRIDVTGCGPGATSLKALLDSAPNPNAATPREAIESALTRSEQERFVAELERALASGTALEDGRRLRDRREGREG